VWENLVFAAQDKRLARAVVSHLASADATGRATRERLEQVLAVTGLADVRDQPVARLSYGQQKMVELGGLIVMTPDPVLYMLDEPFAGLAQADIERYLALLQGLRGRGKTFLIVEHNMRVMYGAGPGVTFWAAARLLGQEGVIGQSRRRAPGRRRGTPRARGLARSWWTYDLLVG
jgi:ABC-type branched-subunit amino acid transport system ATPase component